MTFNTVAPWSGHYILQPEVWGHAHICQFTKVGWKYVDGEGCGYLKGGGSYNSYKSTNGTDYTVVMETRGAKADQPVTFNIAGGLSTQKVGVWKSDKSAMFQKLEYLAPQNGAIALTLKPDSIYTLSTTTGQAKGSHPAAPALAPFPFPYHENYDHYKATGDVPYYHADIDGVFEVANRPNGQGKCLQTIVKFPNTKRPLDGFTVIGDVSWKDYQVSVDVANNDTGSAALLGRISATRGRMPKGYVLKLAKDGAWSLLAGNDAIASGQAKLADQPWHNLKLIFQGTSIKAVIDGAEIASVNNSVFAAGMAGLGTCMSAPLFDNLIISKLSGATPKPTIFFQDEMKTQK